MRQLLRTYQNILLLHFVVIIFGFTAILGKVITVDSSILVGYRMFFAVVALIFYSLLRGKQLRMKKGGTWKTLLTGLIIAAHWIFFFEAIKQSTVSVALAAISSASLFTSLIEPIFFKRKLYAYEVVFGLMAMAGLYFIYRVEADNSWGIILGIISAFLASSFTVINGRLIRHYDSLRISIYELGGGFLAICLYLWLSRPISLDALSLSSQDLYYLLVLAIVCTAFAFVASVEVMKELTPFTVSLTINLEPVYGILLAFFIFGEDEKMSLGFYLGTLLILMTIFGNIIVKRKKRKATMGSA